MWQEWMGYASACFKTGMPHMTVFIMHTSYLYHSTRSKPVWAFKDKEGPDFQSQQMLMGTQSFHP
jgi:hypothetical protein